MAGASCRRRTRATVETPLFCWRFLQRGPGWSPDRKRVLLSPMVKKVNLMAMLIPSIFLEGGRILPPQKTYNPPNGCQIMCSNSFFSTGQRITTISLKYSLMDNKHRKLFVTGQSKGRKFHTFCTVTGGNYCKFQKLNK